MRKIIMLFIGIILCAGCASNTETPPASLTPLPVAMTDPSDAQLHSAVRQYFTTHYAPAQSQYLYARHDLNRDGRREGIVLLQTPYRYWCNDTGCPAIIFQAHNGAFKPISTIQNIRAPLYISHTTRNGWNTLIARVAGGPNAPHDAALIYGTRGYHTDTRAAPIAHAYYTKDIRLFYD